MLRLLSEAGWEIKEGVRGENIPKRDGAGFLTSGAGDRAALLASARAAPADEGEDAKAEAAAGMRVGDGAPTVPLENMPFPMPNMLLSPGILTAALGSPPLGLNVLFLPLPGELGFDRVGRKGSSSSR